MVRPIAGQGGESRVAGDETEATEIRVKTVAVAENNRASAETQADWGQGNWRLS